MDGGIMSKDNLPKMSMVHQRFKILPPIDIQSEMGQEWNRNKDKLNLRHGAEVAVGVGSRGEAGSKAWRIPGTF